MAPNTRYARPGSFFAVSHWVDSSDDGERYTSIAMDYQPHSIVSVTIPVRPGDYIKAQANGQIDQESVTNVIEVCQVLKGYHGGVWYEMNEETGVNINARSAANIAAQLDRHHEDFTALGFLDLSMITTPRPVEVHWMFRARNGGTSAPIPADSARLFVEAWREFGTNGQ
jgi:hypothetical protein